MMALISDRHRSTIVSRFGNRRRSEIEIRSETYRLTTNNFNNVLAVKWWYPALTFNGYCAPCPNRRPVVLTQLVQALA
jgi:hypothetical protein